MAKLIPFCQQIKKVILRVLSSLFLCYASFLFLANPVAAAVNNQQTLQQQQMSSLLTNSQNSQNAQAAQNTQVPPAAPAANAQQLLPSPAPSSPKATSSESAAGSVSVQSVNNAAFEAAAQNALPMTPEQIQRLRKLFNQTQFAASQMPGVPPRPAISSQYVNLEPGSVPGVIRLAQGYVSTLTFLDSTGQPWPIENYDVGNPGSFNIQWDKKSNILMIQATTLYGSGNMAVQLRGLATPVMLTLISGQKAVDYRADLRIRGFGPNAKMVLGRGLPEGSNPELLGVLDGVPPVGHAVLHVSGAPAQVWLVGDRLYIRTRLTLLSPAWIATMSSPDGMKAYEMPKAPLILGSQNGKPVQLKIEGL